MSSRLTTPSLEECEGKMRWPILILILTSRNRMHESCILIHMRTTLNINDDLLKQAARLSGITEKTAVVHAGLEALVARESAKRLAAMGGSEPRVRKIRRRRPRAPLASR